MMFNVDEIEALESSMVRVALFCKIKTTPEVNIWTGIGNFTLAAGQSVLDQTNSMYRNAGQLRSIPAFNQVVNGQAERFEAALSGVSEEALTRFVHADSDQIRGAAFYIGVGVLSDTWQLLGQIHWIRRGRIDAPVFSQSAQSAPNTPRDRSIGVSVGSVFTGRRRPPLLVWTDQAQKRRSPGDRYCERVVINTEIQKDWPRFDSSGGIKGDDNPIK